MKRSKSKLSAFIALAMTVLFNCFSGAALGGAVGHPLIGMIFTNGVGLTQNVVRMWHYTLSDSYTAPRLALSGLNKEVWIDDVLIQLRAGTGFLEDGIDMSQWVQNHQINLAAEGADPVVVINSTAVLSPVQRTDTPLAITLDTYRSTPTLVTDMEEAELVYDKMASVNRQHVLAINQKIAQNTAWNWAPAANTAATPVVLTTGGNDGAGLKLLTGADFATLSQMADTLNWPDEGRTVVLDSATMWGLINNDPKLTQQYGFLASLGKVPGVITEYYGWKIRKYNYQPTYRLVSSVWTRNAFGSTPTSGTDFQGGFAYVAKQNITKAYGQVKMFSLIDEPTAQADTVSYRVRATGRKKQEYMVAAILRTTAS